MPIRRKLEEAVPILLRVLRDEEGKGSNTQDLSKLLTEIGQYFEERPDLFRNLKETEDELLKNFTALEEAIDDSKYSIDGSGGDAASAAADTARKLFIVKKFKSIQGIVPELKGLTPKKIEEFLKNNESEDQAREVSEEWSALKVEHRILKHSVLSRFQLSYDHIIDHKMYKIDGNDILGRTIKLCLLFFSVFPAKSVIKKRPLIYWWLGEGLITKMEEGESIFGELIKKGFLIAEYKPYEKGQDKNPIVDRCRMHSWIRRMLISVAKEAQFFDFDVDTGLPANHGNVSRRMCLVKQRSSDEETPPNREAPQQERAESAEREPRLLTLFNVNEQYLNMSNIKRFSEENKMVVLQLGRWQDSAKHHIEVENEDFLKALGTKQHLRYLSLRGISRITEIASSIGKLINLEILDLRACHNLEKLPSDISSLTKLTHLDISGCHLLESMPKGLDKLNSLQVLKGFVVATSKRGPGRLGDVAGLKKLRKLSIYIRRDAYIEEQELNDLNKVSTLRILSITWGGGVEQVSTQPSGKPTTIDRRKSLKDRADVNRADISTMNSLSFPPKLEKLDLWCIPSKTKPAWLDPGKLQSLSKLYIRGGELAGFNASSTGRNLHWRVQILRLKYLNNFKEDDRQLRQSFPYLIYLERKNKDGASSSRS